MTWERVVTVDDFFDHPLKGIAFCDGKLVAYERLWDESADDYAELYGVMPIDEDLLPLIEEKAAITERYFNAFHAGEAARETHPALPNERSRYEALTMILHPLTSVNLNTCECVHAEFRLCLPDWLGATVRWHLRSAD